VGLAGTERLYYHDSYLVRFTASIAGLSGGGCRLYFDRTAFYPSSGGQPNDLGTVNGIAVADVVDEGDSIAHVLAEPVGGSQVECAIDWQRRFDHMQQHTGQHVLSAVLVEMFGAQTVGFHMSAGYSTIDVSAAALEPAQVLEAEARSNAIVFENRAVTVSFEDASDRLELRKPSEREGTLRVVAIEGLDRSACGGTHVRTTGEVGAVLIRKVDRAHGATRIEFLCGMRAARRARTDYDALSRIARTLSAPLDETPALVAAQAEQLAAAGKATRKLAVELAQIRGKELYATTAPDPAGLRRHERRIASGALDDEVRSMAQGFTSNPKAAYLAVVDDPPSVLLAVSADAGIHAGNAIRKAVAAAGGRGGGNALVGQGSVPSREALARVVAELND
jgi:alanyl-tRNA synthetase